MLYYFEKDGQPIPGPGQRGERGHVLAREDPADHAADGVTVRHERRAAAAGPRALHDRHLPRHEQALHPHRLRALRLRQGLRPHPQGSHHPGGRPRHHHAPLPREPHPDHAQHALTLMPHLTAIHSHRGKGQQIRFIWGFLDQKSCSSSRRMAVSLRQSFFSDWQPAIFCRQCSASSSTFPQCDSRRVSTRSTAIETASVLRPFAVRSVFLSSRRRRLMRYLEKAMLERDLSVIWLFFCLRELLRTSVCRARLFSLSASSSTPMSLIWQSSRNSSRSRAQCFDSPSEYSVLFVMRCQLMLRFSDSSDPHASVFRKQLTPSSSTDVACRSSSFRCRRKGDSARMTSPSLEISEFPQRTSCSSLPSQAQRAMRTSESSVIWLSARFSTSRAGKTVSSQRRPTAASVMKLKFCERSRAATPSGALTPRRSLRESSLMLEFLKESALAFSMLLLQIASLSSESSAIFSCSDEEILSFRTGTRQQSIMLQGLQSV